MEDRKCPECSSGEVEDVKHFLMKYEAWDGERKKLMEKMKSLVAEFDEEEEERRLALILDLACKKVSIKRCVDKVWTARFVIKKKLSPARYNLRTLCYDPHLRFPSNFYLCCRDIPPIVICATICTVLHRTGCPSVVSSPAHFRPPLNMVAGSGLGTRLVIVCPTHDALKAH